MTLMVDLMECGSKILNIGFGVLLAGAKVKRPLLGRSLF